MTTATDTVTRTSLGTVDRMTLRDAVKWVRGAVNLKSAALPALKSIVLEVQGDLLAVRATDLDVAVEVLVPFDPATDAPSDLLPLDDDALNRATMIDGDTLLLETVDGLGRNGGGIPLVEVTGDKLTARVNRGCQTEDYPVLPDMLNDGAGQPLTDDSLAHLAHLASVASTDRARPVLTGVCFSPDGTAAATDSYRLAVTVEVPDGLDGLVPARIVKRVAKLTDVRMQTFPEVGTVRFIGTNVAGPKSARREVTVRLAANMIDGEFPSYGKLLPDRSKDDVIISLDDPAAAASSLTDGAKLLTAANSPVTLTVNGRVEADAAAFRFDVAATTIQHGIVPFDETGEDDTALRWAANPAYLADGLAMLADVDEHDVSARFRDGRKPAVFTSGGLVYLLMPMRIN